MPRLDGKPTSTYKVHALIHLFEQELRFGLMPYLDERVGETLHRYATHNASPLSSCVCVSHELLSLFFCSRERDLLVNSNHQDQYSAALISDIADEFLGLATNGVQLDGFAVGHKFATIRDDPVFRVWRERRDGEYRPLVGLRYGPDDQPVGRMSGYAWCDNRHHKILSGDAQLRNLCRGLGLPPDAVVLSAVVAEEFSSEHELRCLSVV